MIDPRHPDQPFHIVLSKDRAGKWREHIIEEAVMKARLGTSGQGRDKVLHDKWTKRTKGKKPKPRYSGTDHVPVIVTDNETVRFEGPRPFCVMVVPEPEVTPAGLANPFASVPNSAVPFAEFAMPDGAGKYFVQRQVTNDTQAFNQLFYKMIFLVFDDNGLVLVDPDFFCDR